MLHKRIVDLARKTAAPQLKDRDNLLAISAGELKAKMQGNGRLYVYMMDLYAREIGARAEIIWRNLHRAHTSLGAELTDNLGGDLREAFREDLDAALSALMPSFDRDMKGGETVRQERGWRLQLGDARDRELRRYEAEIEHYVALLESTKARGASSAPSYVIHGNVGAVVTGAGSVANVVQNIGSSQREDVLRAIELARQAIAQTPQLVEQTRQDLQELADDAVEEVNRERPNSRLSTSV